MKALVLNGCAHRVYFNYLKAAHPDWDVRAAVPLQSDKWLEEGHAGYIGFLKELDVFVGLVHRPNLQGLLKPDVKRVPVPAFSYFGHQPDAVFLDGINSTLSRGLAHSRIGVSCWMTGQSVADAEALFTAAHYETLGYFAKREKQSANLLRVFETRGGGLDISGLLNDWIDRPGLFWYPSHPRVGFLFEIMRLAMAQAGFTPEIDAAALDAVRDDMEDYLGEGVHWPIYPEIAAHHGIEAVPEKWRESNARGEGDEFGLTEMLTRSFAIYNADPDKTRAAVEKAMISAENIARHAGRA